MSSNQPITNNNTNTTPSNSRDHRSNSVLPHVRGARPSPLRVPKRGSPRPSQLSVDLNSAVKQSRNIGFTSTRPRGMSKDLQSDAGTHQPVTGISTARKHTSRNVGGPKSFRSNMHNPVSSSRHVSQFRDQDSENKTATKVTQKSGFQQTRSESKTLNSSNQQNQGRMPKDQMLPGLSSVVERTKSLYTRNYVLDMDTQLLSQRQNQGRVNTYYDNIIKKSIFQTAKPSPLLSPEKASIMNNLKKAHFNTRGGSVVHTASKHHDDFNDRLLNVETQINADVGGEFYLPVLKNVMSQDNLIEEHLMLYNQKNAQSMVELGAMREENFSTDNRATAIDTHPQTQSNQGPTTTMQITEGSDQMLNQQLSMAESVLQQSQLMDPVAGNSVVNYLNTSLRQDARQQVTYKIEKAMLERERMRKRRDLAGPEEIIEDLGKFAHTSALEEVEKEKSASDLSDHSKTDSLANSSVYNVLMDDMEGVQAYLNEGKEEQERLMSTRKSTMMSKLNVNKSFKKEDTLNVVDDQVELKLMRDNPEAYFKKMKAKIKLKAVKNYHEDVVKQKEEEEKKTDVTAVIKDKFGRVMTKVAPKMTSKKLPSFNRKPVKKAPLKRHASFTKAQMKFFDEDVYNPMKNAPQPTLTDKYIIDAMKEVDRFPIPEALVGRTRNTAYTLKIDSLISAAYKTESVLEWANYRQELDAPYCSMHSEEEFPIYDSNESDEIQTYPYIPKEKLAANPDLKKKQFDVRLLESSPWRIESMRYYPYRSRDGDFPLKLLKIPQIDTLWTCQAEILEQQKEKRWSHELIQNIFEHFCNEMKAAPINLESFYNFDDPNCYKISFKNYQIDEQTMKALIMIIPYLLDFVEIELFNNQTTDATAPALMFAIYCNPTICRLTIAYNYMRNSFSRCLSRLMTLKPEKLNEINLMGSIVYTDHIEPLIRQLPRLKTLKLLNIAGCTMTHAMCRDLASFMQSCWTLGVLDVSHCRINYQGSRYLIDALNRNTTIRNFNFSHNDLTSSTYEFSVKVASLITRHPSLQHLDISNTSLRREEVMFIGLSLPVSKTLLSVHLTAQKLPYYERIFLRAAIAARVGFQYRKSTQKKAIASNKEKNQILTMVGGEVQEFAMVDYTNKMKELDDKRLGMDFEIQDLLAEMDTQASFKDVNPNPDKNPDVKDGEAEVTQTQPPSQVRQLIEKLIERQKEIDAQQQAIKDQYSESASSYRSKENDVALLEATKLEKELHEMFNPKDQRSIRKPEDEQNAFQKMRELKVERQRIKAEIEVVKDGVDRSAGELALMFMGINQVARDLLVENPMTGYMNEIIFSRILGHDEIEEGTFWVDTTQCWVCQKWDKVEIQYNEKEDVEVFVQKIGQMDRLNERINASVDLAMEQERNAKANDEESEMVSANLSAEESSFIREAPEELEGSMGDTNKMGTLMNMPENRANETGVMATKQSTKNLPKIQGLSANPGANTQQPPATAHNNTTQDAHGGVSPSGVLKENADTDKRSEQLQTTSVQAHRVIDEANIGLDQTSIGGETQFTALVNPVKQVQDTSNPIAPVATSRAMVNDLVYPKNFSSATPIHYRQPRAEDIWGEEQKQLEMLQKIGQKYTSGGANNNSKNQITVIPQYRNTDPSKLNFGHLLHGSRSPRNDDDTRKSGFVGSRGGSSFGDGMHSSVISHSETKRRKRGEPVIIQRQIFFDGVVYQIEEELYSDSDHSSKYTSEDSFEIDKQIQKRFKKEHPLAKELEDLEYNSQGSMESVKKFQKLGTEYLDIKGKRNNSAGKKDEKNNTGQGFKKANTSRIIEVDMIDDENSEKIKSEKAKDKGDKKSSQNDNDSDAKSVQSSFKKSQRSQHMNVRNAMQQELFSHSVGLNKAQKDYETKVTSKYYKPQLMKRRLEYFENSLKKLKGKKASGQNEIYIMASFNDWIPMRMKTMRMLLLERYPIETVLSDIPKQCILADNSVNQYSMMIPPGQHFFYFAREKGAIFLSPKYDVVRFKSTEIFLNRIKVNKRLEMITTVHMAKDGEEDEAVFMKDRSVFRDYREDTTAYLMKCFEEDFQYGKISRTVNKKGDVEAELAEIKACLFREYVPIINIFDYYSGISSYPTISINDQTSFSNQCAILDHENIKLADLDLILVATCVSINEYVSSAERDMQRYEFMEMLVRVAHERLKGKSYAKSVPEAIEKVLYDMIYPNAKTMDGENFRRYFCYNVKSNEILKKNELHIKKVYDSWLQPQKLYVLLTECKSFVRKVGLNVSEMMVGAIYAESMMTIFDTIKDPIRPNQMKYVEFIVFLCRICHEHYQGGPYESELLYLKLEHLMPAILGFKNLAPLFLFGERFSIEEERDRKKNKRRKQKLIDQYKNSKIGGRPVDMKLVDMVVSYENQHKKPNDKDLRSSQLSLLSISSESDLGEDSDESKQKGAKGHSGHQAAQEQDSDSLDHENKQDQTVGQFLALPGAPRPASNLGQLNSLPRQNTDRSIKSIKSGDDVNPMARNTPELVVDQIEDAEEEPRINTGIQIVEEEI